MVAINLPYTEEQLTSKPGKFYCGSGYVKCLIVSNEVGESRYATVEKPKPKVLKVCYHVAAGEYQGRENYIEFELWDNTDIQFKNGGHAPASQIAGQNLRSLSIACGFDATVTDSDQLNGKFVMINHEIKKGQPIEEQSEYGQKIPKLDANGNPEHYPDESDIAKGRDKFKAVPEVMQGQVDAVMQPTQPQPPAQPVQQVAPQATQQVQPPKRARSFLGVSIMPKFEVELVLHQPKTLEIWASDESEAEEKATDIALGWNNVDDAEVISCCEI